MPGWLPSEKISTGENEVYHKLWTNVEKEGKATVS